MTPLTDIRLMLADDLRRMNEIISVTLKSDTPLMNTIVEQYLRTKGKQLRPMLVLLAARMTGGVNERVLNAGAAIEMLHNASLIHDDVIDQAQQRRGIATISSVWTNHVAVLVGDFFVTGALQCAVKTDNPEILRSLSEMGADLALGEINQYDTARRHTADEAAYLKTISKKTASLFVACVTVGALAAGAQIDEIQPLREYARLMGLVFQIKDDTFDYIASDRVVGKPTGNDLREGKLTLPLIYALNQSGHPNREAMNQLVQKEILTTDEIEQLVHFAKQAGGIDYAYATMRRLQAEASRLLADQHDSDTVDALEQIFAYIIDREK